MKRLACLLLMIAISGVFSSASAGADDVLPQPAFPLDAAEIILALQKAGLPGEISESETSSKMEGQVLHVVRSLTETYSDTGSMEEAPDDPGSRVITAAVTSAVSEGERVIFAVFHQKGVSDPFSWEDWKRQIVFATLLYGGFEGEEEVYRALTGKALPEGPGSYEWDAQLPGGYCTLRYESRTQDHEQGNEQRHQFTSMSLSIFESQALYQRLRGEH